MANEAKMEFNFDELKSVDFSNKKANTLSPRKQEFANLRYRRTESKKKGKEVSKFFISNARFEELNLAVDGLRQFVHPNDKTQVFLAVVDTKDAKILKTNDKGDKGTNFKSDALEAALVEAGIISTNIKGPSQYIDIKLVGENRTLPGNIAAKKIFFLSKGEALKTEEPAEEIKSAPAAEPEQPNAAPTVADSGWND